MTYTNPRTWENSAVYSGPEDKFVLIAAPRHGFRSDVFPRERRVKNRRRGEWLFRDRVSWRFEVRREALMAVADGFVRLGGDIFDMDLVMRAAEPLRSDVWLGVGLAGRYRPVVATRRMVITDGCRVAHVACRVRTGYADIYTSLWDALPGEQEHQS